MKYTNKIGIIFIIIFSLFIIFSINVNSASAAANNICIGSTGYVDVPTTSISVKSGSYNTFKNVTIKASKPGSIYYTVNGITPTTSSSVYESPLIIKSNTTLKYFATDIAGNPSSLKTETININNGFLESFNHYNNYNKVARSTLKYKIKWETRFGHPNRCIKITYGSKAGPASCVLYQNDQGYDAKVFPLLNIGYFSGGLGAQYPIKGDFKIDMYRAGQTADDAKSYIVHFNGNQPTVITPPKNQIRWAYMAYTLSRDYLTQDDFNRVAKWGFTDVCHLAGNIMDDYDNCVYKTNLYARYAKNAGLKYHAGIYQFRKTDKTFYNPAYIDSNPSPFLITLRNFIKDCPNISGISFDDFVYPKVFYNEDNDAIQRTHLKSIARRSNAIVHKAGLCFSIAMFQARSAHMEEIAPYCDLLLPENTHRYSITSSNFLSGEIKKALKWAGDCKIIPSIATYRDNRDHAGTMWTEDFIKTDIDMVNRLNPNGYNLWVYPYIPHSLYRQEIPLTAIKTSFNGRWQNVVLNLGNLFDCKAFSSEYHIIRIAFEGTITSDDLLHRNESAIWFDQINAQSGSFSDTGLTAPYYDFKNGDIGHWTAENGIMYYENSAPQVSVNIKGGLYKTSKIIKLSMNRPGKIYYTLNNNNPTTSSRIYTGPIILNKFTVLKYVAVDNAGNPSHTFKQTYCIDKIAPTVSNINPRKGSVYVLSNNIIKITFSELVKYGRNPLVVLKYGNTVIPITKSIYRNVLTINHLSKFTNGKYTLTLYPGCVVDSVGNPSSTYTSSFVVNDTVPKVIFTDPANLKTNVTISSGIVVKFNKNILKNTDFTSIKVKNLSNNMYITSTCTIAGSVLYITTAQRKPLTWYQVIIPSKAVKDDANNNLKSIYNFTFQTTKQ